MKFLFPVWYVYSFFAQLLLRYVRRRFRSHFGTFCVWKDDETPFKRCTAYAHFHFHVFFFLHAFGVRISHKIVLV